MNQYAWCKWKELAGNEQAFSLVDIELAAKNVSDDSLSYYGAVHIYYYSEHDRFEIHFGLGYYNLIERIDKYFKLNPTDRANIIISANEVSGKSTNDKINTLKETVNKFLVEDGKVIVNDRQKNFL